MKQFVERENLQLQKLKERFPSNSEYFVSFLESVYLPKDKGEELISSNYLNEEEFLVLIKDIGNQCLDQFKSHYFKAIISLLSFYNIDFNGKEFTKFLSSLDKSLLEEEPFFDWLIKEGIPILNNIREGLHVSKTDELATLVRELNFLGSLLLGHEEYPDMLVSSFYDIPNTLYTELSTRNMLCKNIENNLTVVLGKPNYLFNDYCVVDSYVEEDLGILSDLNINFGLSFKENTINLKNIIEVDQLMVLIGGNKDEEYSISTTSCPAA